MDVVCWGINVRLESVCHVRLDLKIVTDIFTPTIGEDREGFWEDGEGREERAGLLVRPF